MRSTPRESLRLSVNPFRHPLTRPGKYPFLVTADSKDAKDKNPVMAATDPSGGKRLNATDVAFVMVKSFWTESRR